MDPKPKIYEATHEGRRLAWLVDEFSAYLSPDENGTPRHHFAAAVEIDVLMAGELREMKDLTGGSIIGGPRCCVLSPILLKKGATLKTNDIKHRGFHPKAAAVLLKLAAASNAVNVNYAAQNWQFEGPLLKAVPEPWNHFKFLAAWRWSSWVNTPLAALTGKGRKLTGTERHSDMVALGYPHHADALRQMTRRMGL